VEQVFTLLIELDEAFCNPVQITRKKVEEGQNVEMENEEEVNDGSKDLEIVDGFTIKKRKIQFFRFWPKELLRNAWRNYLATGESGANLNGAYLAVQVLEKVTEQFVLNCIKKQQKKAEKLGAKNDFLKQFESNN